MAMKAENAEKFRAILVERKITDADLRACIARHAKAKYPQSVHERTIAAANLRKELSRGEMTDKVLAKGLKIIGMTDAEAAAATA